MRVRSILVLCVALAVTVGVAPAAGRGGNSQNAKKCQKGGYKNWVRADQTPFKNVGQCVSYGAHGGTLTQPAAPMDRAFCAPSGPPTFGQCFIPGQLDLDFDASSSPLGENPTGTFLFERLPNHFGGDVTCLQVNGNVASVGGVITDPASTLPVGFGFAFTAVDNGPGVPDMVSVYTLLGSPPAADTPDCGSEFPADSFGQMTGDIIVQDA